MFLIGSCASTLGSWLVALFGKLWGSLMGSYLRRWRLAAGDASPGGSFEDCSLTTLSVCLLLCSDENMITQLSAPACCHAFHNSLCFPSHDGLYLSRTLSQNKPFIPKLPFRCVSYHINRNVTVTIFRFSQYAILQYAILVNILKIYLQ